MIIKDVDWSNVDAASIRRLIAESDAEGGELSREEVSRELDRAQGARVTRGAPDQA